MATKYVTPNGAGSKDGSDWSNAYDYSAFETYYEGSLAAGDVIYIKPESDGSGFSLTSDLTPFVAGTITAPVKIIGVKKETTNTPPVGSDYAYGTDRPLFTCGAYNFAIGSYFQVMNLRFTGSATDYTTGTSTGDYCLVVNCKATNTSSGYALQLDNYSTVIGCEVDAASDIALRLDVGGRAIYCNIRDSSSGASFAAATHGTAYGCIISGCSTNGMTAGTNFAVINSTIYDCSTGINGGAYNLGILINNIINCHEGGQTGVSYDSGHPYQYADYNCWYNDTDVVNFTKGPHAVNSDPKLKDPANDDFTLDTGSPCFDAGMQPDANIGL